MKLKKQRWKRRPKGPLPFRYVFLLSIVIFTLLTLQGLWLVDQGIRPTLMAIAKTETQKIATRAINDAISKKIVESTEMEDLVKTEKGPNGEITSIQFDSAIYNRVLNETTIRVQNFLQMVEDGEVEDLSLPDGIEVERSDEMMLDQGIIHMIPLGQATNNALLAHLGPEVPVQFSAIGDVTSSMSEEIVESGINNTYLRISVDVEVDVKVVIPFATDTAVVATSIPLGMVFIPGEVPDYYNEGGGEMPAPAIIDAKDLNEYMREQDERTQSTIDPEADESREWEIE